MKLATPLIPGALLLTIVGIGCATEKPPETAPSNPLDVAPPPSTTGPAAAGKPRAYAPPPAAVFTPPPQDPEDPFAMPDAAASAKTPSPVKTASPWKAPSAKPAAKPAASARADGSHTVQKGDTLFRIAKDRYGDGSKWEKIASANPGVTPASLKVGQKLKVP